jgi:hypothetical protein
MYIHSQSNLCCQSTVTPESNADYVNQMTANIELNCSNHVPPGQQCPAQCRRGTMPNVVLRRQSEARTMVEFFSCEKRSSVLMGGVGIFSSTPPVIWNHTGDISMRNERCTNAFGQRCVDTYYLPPFTCSPPISIKANSHTPTRGSIGYRDQQLWFELEVVQDVRCFVCYFRTQCVVLSMTSSCSVSRLRTQAATGHIPGCGADSTEQRLRRSSHEGPM